ncbi:MAG: polysaccharide biosynthesis protein [Defluviitaleaceae bacterium]|nr:polysaccharide biosynthesis protein [Defluviitaleaceae bacterium]
MEKANSANSFVRQAAILAVAGISARLLGFLYRLPLTHLIGDEGNAVYAVGFYVYSIFLIISSAGLPAAISKLVSEKRAIGRHDLAHKIFVIAFILSASVGAVFMAVIFIFAQVITEALGTPMAYLALQTLAPTVFIVAMMAVIRGYFQGMSSTVPTAISQVTEQVFNAIFSIILAHAMWNFALRQGHETIVYGAAGGTAGTGVGALAGLIIIAGLYFIARPDIIKEVRLGKNKARRFEAYTAESNSQIVRNIATTSFIIVAGTAIFSVASLIDVWLVTDRLSAAGLGEVRARELFGQLTGKFNPLTNLPAAISSSLAIAVIPAIAAAKAVGNHRDVAAKINTALRAAMLLTVPIAFGLGALGPQIVALLFPSHPEGGTLFVVGFPSVIFLAISQIATGVLQAIGKISIPVFAALAGAAVKIVVSFFLIANPAVNIYGAIIGTILMYLVTAGINCIFLSRHTGTRLDFVGILAKPTMASLAMALACYTFYHLAYWLLDSNAAATLLAIFVGMGVYAVFMVLIKGFADEDIRLLPRGQRLLNYMKRKGFV